MNILQSIIIGIVEGITEFLPVSSTGHMIIVKQLLGIENSNFVNLFIVNIQFGAILSVVVLYWKRFTEPLAVNTEQGSFLKRFIKKFDFYLKLLVAFIPAAVFGFLFIKTVNAMLENVLIVAISLVAGGVILILSDKWFRNPEKKELTFSGAFKIGLFQVISMIPGVSRSAATIIGGLTQKLDRKKAAEFSFFLAVPTMLGASVFELYNNSQSFEGGNIWLLITGNIVAFIVAMVAIRAFISFLTKNGFRVFGYYRIAVGLVILVLLALGVDLQLVG
jgi:undecaprenyl-diphosphatase